MAAAQSGVTLTFALSTTASVQLSVGLANRHGFLIQNNDLSNVLAVGFGTNNAATAAMFMVQPGSTFSMGESGNVGGTGPQQGPAVPTTDIAAIAVTGTPNLCFMEW